MAKKLPDVHSFVAFASLLQVRTEALHLLFSFSFTAASQPFADCGCRVAATSSAPVRYNVPCLTCRARPPLTRDRSSSALPCRPMQRLPPPTFSSWSRCAVRWTPSWRHASACRPPFLLRASPPPLPQRRLRHRLPERAGRKMKMRLQRPQPSDFDRHLMLLPQQLGRRVHGRRQRRHHLQAKQVRSSHCTCAMRSRSENCR